MEVLQLVITIVVVEECVSPPGSEEGSATEIVHVGAVGVGIVVTSVGVSVSGRAIAWQAFVFVVPRS